MLFTPHLVPGAHLATCYAPGRVRIVDGTAPRALPEYTPTIRGVVVDEPSSTKATYGANVVHVTSRFDERTNRVAIAPRTTS